MTGTARRTIGALAAALVSLAVLAPSASADAFAFMCKPSHRLQDDPIVNYGTQAGHMHDFFGNRSTDRWSTRDTLFASSPALCNAGGDWTADRSAYWFPTLYQLQGDGTFKAINPTYSTVYYRRPVNDGDAVQLFPRGLKVIAGNSKATSPQPVPIVDWYCYHGTMDANGPAPYCHEDVLLDSKPATLRLKIQFPSCSNGLPDSPDHQSHMAYPTAQRTCPVTHPIPVPKIEMFTYYPTAGGPNADEQMVPGAVKLSSGGHFSAHADFFEAWDEDKLRNLVDRCVRPDPPC